MKYRRIQLLLERTQNMTNGGLQMNEKIEKLLNALRHNAFKPEYFKNRSEAIDYMLSSINTDATIGIGGSVTIDELGIYDKLIRRGNKAYWHWKGDEITAADSADIYLSSTNAVSLQGIFYFVDGFGNRIRNITRQDKSIYLVFGTNKIVENEHSLLHRVKTIAAPKNAIRLEKNLPCSKLGYCMDCNSKDRMCNYFLKIAKNPHGNIKPIIIEGDFGY